MRICNSMVLMEVARLIHQGIQVTRDMQQQIEERFMLPTYEEFKESPEAQLYLRTIYDVRIAGNVLVVVVFNKVRTAVPYCKHGATIVLVSFQPVDH